VIPRSKNVGDITLVSARGVKLQTRQTEQSSDGRRVAVGVKCDDWKDVNDEDGPMKRCSIRHMPVLRSHAVDRVRIHQMQRTEFGVYH